MIGIHLKTDIDNRGCCLNLKFCNDNFGFMLYNSRVSFLVTLVYFGCMRETKLSKLSDTNFKTQRCLEIWLLGWQPVLI